MNDRALAVIDPMSEWQVMREQAEVLVRSRLLPRAVDTAEKAIAIIQTGRELGIGPMQALRAIHVIEGKPTMSAELMAGLVLARLPGSTLRVASTTNEECTVEASRHGQEPTLFRFSMADARAAGLQGKDNWKKYPAAMLRARCLAAASRAIFPDATMGMLTPDELGAVTNEDGSVMAHATVVEQTPQLGPHSPHDDGADYSDASSEAFDKLVGMVAHAEDLANKCSSYENVLELEEYLGSRAKQSELTKAIQAAKEARSITPEQHKILSAKWQHLYRELTKEKPPGLKARYPAPDAAASFVDADPEDDGR